MDFTLSILMLYQFWASPGLDSTTWATCCMVGYAVSLFTALTLDYIVLTPPPGGTVAILEVNSLIVNTLRVHSA